MKYKIGCFIIIYSMAFVYGNVVYKATTKEGTLLAINAYCDKQLENLEKIITDQLEKRLSNFENNLMNILNGLIIQSDIIKKQFFSAIEAYSKITNGEILNSIHKLQEQCMNKQENILHETMNFEYHLNRSSFLFLELFIEIKNEQQKFNKQTANNLESTKNIEKRLDDLNLQYLNVSSTVAAHSKNTNKEILNFMHTFKNEIFENIIRKRINFEERLDFITSTLSSISLELKNQELNISRKNHDNGESVIRLGTQLNSQFHKEIENDELKNILHKATYLKKKLLEIVKVHENHEENIKKLNFSALQDSNVESYNTQVIKEMLNSIYEIQRVGYENINNDLDTLTTIISKEETEKTNQNGIYELSASIPEQVLYDEGGNWTVVMRRFDGSVNFDRYWTEYKNGFGNLNGEFFIGLEKLHIMTSSQGRQDLLITMKETDGTEKFILYDLFTVGNEDEGYMLKELRVAEGNTPNFFETNTKFSTKDVDNDSSKAISCALVISGAGWHNNCFEANLFGLFGENTSKFTAMAWVNKLLSVEMLIRPREWILHA